MNKKIHDKNSEKKNPLKKLVHEKKSAKKMCAQKKSA